MLHERGAREPRAEPGGRGSAAGAAKAGASPSGFKDFNNGVTSNVHNSPNSANDLLVRTWRQFTNVSYMCDPETVHSKSPTRMPQAGGRLRGPTNPVPGGAPTSCVARAVVCRPRNREVGLGHPCRPRGIPGALKSSEFSC